MGGLMFAIRDTVQREYLLLFLSEFMQEVSIGSETDTLVEKTHIVEMTVPFTCDVCHAQYLRSLVGAWVFEAIERIEGALDGRVELPPRGKALYDGSGLLKFLF